MKNKKLILSTAILILLCCAALFIYNAFKPATNAGEKNITVTVIHGDESKADFTYQTDAEYLGDILQEKGLIDGEQGDYGLYVTTVDGETVDESAQEWWCLTKAGESVNTGVDLTPIADGDSFELTLMVGY